MAANDSKSYYSYLNELVNLQNKNYHHCINKKPISPDFSPLTEKK